MPCGVTALGVCAMVVALPPIVQGEQLACVTLKVKTSGFIRFTTGNVPLKAASLEPAITTFEPGTKLAALGFVTVATLLATMMLKTGKGPQGTRIVGSAPAAGMARPCPMRKSP